jgi:hypothetical protein
MQKLIAVFTASLLIVGCSNPNDRLTPVPVENSTYRISSAAKTDGSELTVDIMHNRKRCLQVFSNPDDVNTEEFEDQDARIDMCVPKIDRASGQVQLSFRLAEKDNKNRGLQLPLEKDHLAVLHAERKVPGVDFRPYEPTQVGQLFLILVDHSSSMRLTDKQGVTRMKRVIDALKANKSTFINKKSAVALFRFTNKVEGLDGTPWKDVKPISSKSEFEQQAELLGQDAGWTHLYHAVDVAVGPMLDNDTAVARFLAENDMEPTIVVLTDGFNNTLPQETCGDNAAPLEETLKTIRSARRKPPSKRPTVYTVGFGVGFYQGFEAPEDDVDVSPTELCDRWQHNRIDGDLDKTRIDNASLLWIAKAGGGLGFIKSDHRALKKVFAETAPRRYRWYQVRYKVDPFYHRSKFATRIQITNFAAADSAVTWYPSAWLDAPSGIAPEGERWVVSGDIRRATGVMVLILGGLIFLTFLGPAMFNGRRAMFRRSRKTSKK